MSFELVEKISKYIHEKMWSRWAKHCLKNATPENKKRWKRQVRTRYKNLSEAEKEKDRVFARELVRIIFGRGQHGGFLTFLANIRTERGE